MEGLLWWLTSLCVGSHIQLQRLTFRSNSPHPQVAGLASAFMRASAAAAMRARLSAASSTGCPSAAAVGPAAAAGVPELSPPPSLCPTPADDAATKAATLHASSARPTTQHHPCPVSTHQCAPPVCSVVHITPSAHRRDYTCRAHAKKFLADKRTSLVQPPLALLSAKKAAKVAGVILVVEVVYFVVAFDHPSCCSYC